MITGLGTVVAAVLGYFTPLRYGVAGFLAGAFLAFASMFIALTLRGFEGLPLGESLLLFEGSLAAYLGFNALVAYRAFALPVLVLGAISLIRLRQQH